MTTPIQSRPFGVLPTGKSVEAYTLRGVGGLTLEAITYGGIITRLLVPDRDGQTTDVVLGFSSLDGYATKHPFFGALVGRVAGRIPGASFQLNGETYTLPANEGANHLHGGVAGFDKKLWKAEPGIRHDLAPTLRLTAFSADGEEGYPGNVEVSVTYTITSENVLLMETDATSDRVTPFSLTQHTYFNLAGEAAATIHDHILQIHSDEFVPVGKDMAPLGRLQSVAGPEDFRKPRCLDTAIPGLFAQHGALYRVRKARISGGNPGLFPAAKLIHVDSGRILEVFTTENYLQLYTGSRLNGAFTGKFGTPYSAHAGLCLECEGYADAVNSPALDNILLFPGEKHYNATAYVFSTIPLDDLP